ncbi:MAG: glycosyltransferase [Verrucomicrobiales bacterium]|nr:glycosyltransferase [Verrucomicrobiales bacterium]
MIEVGLHVLLSIIFWGSVGLIVYTYAVYPPLLSLLARGKALPQDRFESDDEFPEVAVLMAVYNEEAVIEKTIRSILNSDYPKSKLHLWIGSDGSTDRSHQIVEEFQIQHPDLHLNVFEGRNGKIRIINQLAIEAKASLKEMESAAFVLCDANVVWSKGALRNMVRHLKRDEVGLIGSSVMDEEVEHEGIGDEEEAYVGRENRTKYFEGILWGNMMGAFGACYALRAKLFVPVPTQYIVDDFFQTMACLEGGHLAIVDLEAEVYEAVSVQIEEEFRRKTRIATGNFQNLKHFWKFFLPWNGGLATTFAFWSHKGFRWVGPHLMRLMLGSAVVLSFINPWYWIALAGLLVSGLAAGIDLFLSRKEGRPHIKLFRFTRYFYAMNYAVWLGYLAFRRGVRNSVWEPTKRVEHGRPSKKAKAVAKA